MTIICVPTPLQERILLIGQVGDSWELLHVEHNIIDIVSYKKKLEQLLPNVFNN
jgi:hypothetical protein